MNVRSGFQAEDAAAIRWVINEETEAFLQRDFERWAACFVHDERTHEVSSAPDRGVIVHRGWDAVSRAMRQIMTDNPDEEHTPHALDEIQISVRADMAWATFESRCRRINDDVYPLNDSFQMRVLERHEGQWRIVYLGFDKLRDPRSVRPIVQVDDKARVIWASNRTLDALETFEGLTIVAGRLRATQRAHDKRLAQVISRAADLRHLFDTAYTTRSGNGFVYPVLLGESDGGGTLHCTVFVRDSMVNVSFADAELVEAKIKAAGEIFGLSSGQRRLALEISNGHGIPEAAKAMGISVNTARTHLARVYEKTGVSSQPSLVHLLLSVTPMSA